MDLPPGLVSDTHSSSIPSAAEVFLPPPSLHLAGSTGDEAEHVDDDDGDDGDHQHHQESRHEENVGSAAAAASLLKASVDNYAGNDDDDDDDGDDGDDDGDDGDDDDGDDSSDQESCESEPIPAQSMACPSLLAIVVSEFHVVRGPRVLFAAPAGAMPPSAFVRIKEFVIPKPELFHKLVDVAVPAHGLRLLSMAVNLESEHYPRNNLLFNVAFVFTPRADTAPFRPLLAKTAAFLTALEKESAFVSRHTNMLIEDEDEAGEPSSPASPTATSAETEPLLALVNSVFAQLRESGSANVTVDERNSLFLSLDVSVAAASDRAAEVRTWDVPLLVAALPPQPLLDEWGIALLAVLPFIDGFNYVKRIAMLAGMAEDLAAEACAALVAAGYVALVDIFQFSNVYHTTPVFDALYEPGSALMAQAQRVLAPPGAPPPSRKTVLELYAALRAPRTLSEFCLSHDLDALNIDVLVLVRFGVLHGILRRVHRYVLALEDAIDAASVPPGTLAASVAVSSPDKMRSSRRRGRGGSGGMPGGARRTWDALSPAQAAALVEMADGQHHFDAMCTQLMVPAAQLEDVFAADTFVTFLK